MLLRTTIFLTPAQRKGLESVAKRKGLKVAQVIRSYVDDGLRREARK